jgi:hypothetical protein
LFWHNPRLNVHAISLREVVLDHLNQLSVTLRFIENCSWQESLKRFEHIFDQSEGGVEPGMRKPSIPVYTLPGNHDLGYEAMESAKTAVIWCLGSSFRAVSALLRARHLESLYSSGNWFFNMMLIGCRRWSGTKESLAHWNITSPLEV